MDDCQFSYITKFEKKPMTKGKYPYGEKDLIHECKIRHLPSLCNKKRNIFLSND